MASMCWMAGRIEAAVGYSKAGQMMLGSGGGEMPFGLEGWFGGRACCSASPNGGPSGAAPSSHAVRDTRH